MAYTFANIKSMGIKGLLRVILCHMIFFLDLIIRVQTASILQLYFGVKLMQNNQRNTPFQNQETNIIYNLPKLTSGVVRPIKQFTKPSCQS